MRRVSVPTSRVAIIGAGVSALLFELVANGYSSIDAVDISAAALDQLRERLGSDAKSVRFVCADMRDLHLDHRVDVWHDRATFHFLTNLTDQQRYVQSVNENVAPDGHLVMATFGVAGPEQCSGLPVARHSPEDLAELFGDQFELVESCTRDHVTPNGASQSFTHALLARKASDKG